MNSGKPFVIRKSSAHRQHMHHAVGLSVLALAIKVACGTVALADLPTGGSVVSGAGQLSQSGNTLTVNQQTARMGVEWESFNVGAGQRVQFVQPNANSVALNRVVGSDGSKIMGSLDANGKVFLVNPNGVLFGKDAQVNTGGLVASTLGISDENFSAGNYRFTKGANAGSVVNNGNLSAGSVVLIAPTIDNAGSITTPNGNTTLAAGESVTVSVMNNGLITAQVNTATLNASIKNSGRIIADGGAISLQAGTADAVLDSIINTDGLLQARGVEARDGRIFLGSGAGGTTYVGGTVDASGYAAGQKGGEITALGKHVEVVSGAKLDASGSNGGGTVLVGGNWQGQGSEMNATAVVMQESATIKADATNNGDGGKVVLWADDDTTFAGSITARGGANAGNGGNVETSGKVNLHVSGNVEASAAAGNGGLWLLDPTDYTIGTTEAASIRTTLNSGTNVSVITSAAGGGNGDIFVNSAITKTSGGGASLVLGAHRDIFMAAGITSTSGALSVSLISRYFDGATGTVHIASGANITTRGGALIVRGGTSGGAVGATAADAISLASVISTGGGNVTMVAGNAANSDRAYRVDGTIDAGGGNISLTSNGSVSVVMLGTIRTTGTGSITITGTGDNNLHGVVATQAGAITINNSGGFSSASNYALDISTTTGNINITGTASTAYDEGIYFQGGGTAKTIRSTSGNISLTGISNLSSRQGIMVTNANLTIETGGAGSVSLTGTGGTAAGYNSAIQFGTSTPNTTVTIKGGTGGVTLTGNATVGSANSLYAYGGTHTIQSSGNVTIGGNRIIYFPGTVTATGALTISSTGVSNITLGALNAGGLLRVTSKNGLNLNGAITHDGAGNMLFQAGTDMNLAGSITKTGTADTYVSLESAGSILVTSDISTSAGKLDVLMRSRTGNAAVGVVSLGGNITTGGGNIYVWGGSGLTPGDGAAQAASSVYAISMDGYVRLDANGGNIGLWGASNASGSVAMVFGGEAVINTNGTGNVEIHALSTGIDQGLIVNDGVKIAAGGGGSDGSGTGNVLVQGSSGGTTGIYLGSGTYAAGGSLTINGSAGSGGSGILHNTGSSGNASSLYGGSNLTLTGSGENGISFVGAATTTIKTGTGGTIALNGSASGSGTAVSFGGPVEITGGTGGVAIATTHANSNGIGIASSGSTGFITSTGAISITGQGSYQYLQPINAGGALTVQMTGPVALADITSQGAMSLGSSSTLAFNGAVNATGYDITARATGNLTLNSGAALAGSNIYLASDANFVNNVGASVLSPTGRWIVYSNSPTANTYGGLTSGSKAVWNQSYSTLAPGSAAAGNRYVFRYSPIGGVLSGTMTKTYGETEPLSVPVGTLTPYTNTQGGMWTADIVADIASAGTTASSNLVSSGFAFHANAGLYTVTAGSNITASGYTVSLDPSTQLEVVKRAITVTAQAVTKTYDRTLSSLLTPTITAGSLVAGDTGNWSQLFADRNVGTGKTLIAAGSVTDGNSGNNYTVTLVDAATGIINPFALTAALLGSASKVYDGNTSIDIAAGSYSLTGVIAGDTVSLNDPLTGTLDTKSVGAGKSVSVTGLALAGGSAGNYSVNSTANANIGAVTAKALTASLTGNTSKVYDGNTGITLAGSNYQLTGIVSGDAVTLNDPLTGTLGTKDAGTSKAVSVTGLAISGDDAGNYTLNATANGNIGEVTAKALTATLTNSTSKVYDGATSITLSGSNYLLDGGVIGGDTVDLNNPVSGTLDTKSVGTGKNVAVTGLALSGASAGNYSVNSTANANIGEVTAKALTASLTGNTSKAYDGNTSITLAGSNYQLTGIVSGDAVTLNDPLTGTLDTKSVGTGKTVSVTGLAISGDDAGNYSLGTSINGAIGAVTAKALTASLTGSTGKVYDGDTSISLAGSNYQLTGVVSGDTVDVNHPSSGTLDTKDAGTGKAVAISGLAISGADAGNYSINGTASANIGEVTAKALTAALSGGAIKVYDGATSITLTSSNYLLSGGIIAGDTVTLNDPLTGNLDTKNVGTAKSVAVSGLVLAGGSAGNYSVNSTANANIGAVTAKALTASLTGSTGKVYDGGTSITLAGSNYAMTGVVSGDTVTLNDPLIGTLDTKSAGTGKSVSVTGLAISGGDAGNYTLDTAANGNIGTVTAKSLTASLTGSTTKTYDGTTDITLTGANYQLAGVVSGDTVTINNPTLGALDSRNAGAAKNVAVGGLVLSGGEAGNYTVNTSANADIAQVTQRALVIGAVTGTKVYDRTSASTGTVSLTGLVTGDTVAATQSFDSVNAGNRTLSVDAGYVVGDGNSGNNYAVTTSGASGTIDRRDVIVSVNAASREYDGTSVAQGTVTGITGILAGDTVSSGGTATFAFSDKNVGTGKSVSVSGMTLSGADSANYQVGTANASNAAITTATLTVSAIPDSKVYGSTDAALDYGYSGLKGLDDFTVFSGAQVRAVGENVGIYSISQGTLSAGGNYAISYSDAGLRITPATLLISALAGTKVYGDADPLLGYNQSGLVNGDAASVITGALTRTSGENFGSYAINLGTVSAGGNYTIGYTTNTFNISPLALVVSANDLGKIYGDVDSTLSFTHGTLANGDTDSLFSGSLMRATGQDVGSYAIGQGTLSAGNNYDVQFTGGALNITPRTLTILANSRGKSYGDVDPSLSFTHGTLVNGDTDAIFGGALARAAGENARDYVITQGTLSAGSNYTIDFTGNLFDISTGLLVVNADARTKLYGDLDPSLTYAYSGLVNGDDASVFSGALSRASGENVGNYAIGQGSLEAGANYTVQFNASDLAITRRDLFVTAATASKLYGALDPSLTYAYAGLVNGDTASVFTGGLGRAAGENVNSYAITQSTLSAGGNYTLHYTGNTFAITPAILSVAANAQTKVYGELDPTFSYTYAGLVNGDTAVVFSGDLSRAAGETVLGGPYAIGQGALAAGGNYVIDFTGSNLLITPKALLVDVANNLTKVYDGTTALLPGTDGYSWSGRVGSDDVDVLGTLAFDSRNVGARSISLTDMSLSGADASNYSLSATSATGNGTITARAITVTAQADTKIYDGNTSSSLAALLTSGSLAASDIATWSQSYDDRNAGTGKTLSANGAINDGNGGNNYAVTFVGNHDGVIDRRAITVTSQADTKTYDGSVVSSAAPVTVGAMASGDSVSWSQSFDDRNAGTGKTLIASGMISDGNGGNNYDVTFVSSHDGAIDRRAITVAAQADSKTYDGTVDSGVSPVVTSGDIVSGDSANWSQLFSDAQVGTGKTLTAGGSISDGNDGGNYQVTFVDNGNGVILAVSGGNTGGNGDGTADSIPIIRDSNFTALRDQDPSNPNGMHGGDHGGSGAGGLADAGAAENGRFIVDETTGSPSADGRSTDAALGCSGTDNLGIRMPERPESFLKRSEERSDRSCIFFQ